jgi:hypothetical protein
MTRDLNAVQHGNRNTGNKSFERVKQVKYLRTIQTNQNSFHEEIKEQIEVGECFLSFHAKSLVFQFTIQKYKASHRLLLLLLLLSLLPCSFGSSVHFLTAILSRASLFNSTNVASHMHNYNFACCFVHV